MRKGNWKCIFSAGMVALVLTTSLPVAAEEITEPQADEQSVDEEDASDDVQENHDENAKEDQEALEDADEEEASTAEEEDGEEAESEEASDIEEEEPMVEEEDSQTEEEFELEVSLMSLAIDENVKYKDGTYQGTGKGYHSGKITVEVTITEHKISKVEVIEYKSQTDRFWKKAIAILESFVGLGSIKEVEQVDTVSGATRSSKGIREAVLDALSKADIEEDMNDAIFEEGDGSKDNPYIIKNEAQLRRFAESVSDDEKYHEQYIELSDDITLTESWTPIKEFAGHFDGKGHMVEDITIGSSDAPENVDYGGFFGKLTGHASVENLELKDIEIYVTGTNRTYVGGLAGAAGATGSDEILIDHCVIEGEIISVTSSMYAYAGGVVAYASSGATTIANSYSDIKVEAHGKDSMSMAGGIAASTGREFFAMNDAALGDVYADGHIFSSVSSCWAGGLFALPGGVIYNCYAAGDVTLKNDAQSSNPSVGLVAGQTTQAVLMGNVYYKQDARCEADGTTYENTAVTDTKNKGYTLNVVGVKSVSDENMVKRMEKGLSKTAIEEMNAYVKESTSKEDTFKNDYLSETTWNGWKITDGKVIPTGKRYVEVVTDVSIFESGEGTKENPYILATQEQFEDFAVSLSETEDYQSNYITLTTDIDISGNEWNPIGQTEQGYVPFRGHFDGDSHTVKGLTIGSKDSYKDDDHCQMYYGLFAELGSDAVVSNLKIEDVAIFASGDASLMAGAIAGSMQNATIDGCLATGAIGVKTTNTEDGLLGANTFAGGLVGAAYYSNIVNSWSDVDVDAICRTANAEAGGIAGLAAFGIVANCYTLGNISGETDRTVDDGGVTYLGGIVGCHAQQMANCYQTGNVVSRTWTTMAGSLTGMSTGISTTNYNYYNEDAYNEIQGEKISPVVAIGKLVGTGISEDGDKYVGGIAVNNEAMKASDLKSTVLADKLNDNFKHFPINVNEELPSGIILRKWIVTDGKVILSREAAEVNYVVVELPEEEVFYIDGTYYGRGVFGENAYVYVKAVIADTKVSEISVLQAPETFDTSVVDTIVKETIEKNRCPEKEETDSISQQAAKDAIATALGRALIGDMSGYDLVDPTIFAGGVGTKEDPFQVANATQLRAFAQAVNSAEHFEGKYVVLTKDIDLAGEDWVPVGGTGAHAFSGYFDGRNHVIRNMKIGSKEEPEGYNVGGLFAYASGAVICNTGIADAVIALKRSDENRAYAGILVAAIDNENDKELGTWIDNCSVSGKIYNISSEWCYCGGIAGYSYNSAISNCRADVEIEGSSGARYVDAGSIVGMMGWSAIFNNYGQGSIIADAGVSSASIGGLVGMNGGASINNFADVSLHSKRTTGDIGAITGRNTGIGYIDGAFYNEEVQHKNGDVLIEVPKSVGTNVTMATTGVINNIVALKKAEVTTSKLVDLLNNPQSDIDYAKILEDYRVSLPDGAVPVRNDWYLDNNGQVMQRNSVILHADNTDISEKTDDSQKEETSTTSSGSSSKKKHSSASKTSRSSVSATTVSPASVEAPMNSVNINNTPVVDIAATPVPASVAPSTATPQSTATQSSNQLTVATVPNQERFETEKTVISSEDSNAKEDVKTEVEVTQETAELVQEQQQTEEIEEQTTLPDEEVALVATPQTSNHTTMIILAILTMVAVAGVVTMVYYKKQKRN